MIPPLVTFLPGAALTMSVVEVSAGEMVTGPSRLVAGAIIAIALGVLCGYPLYRSIARSLGWLSELRPVLR